MPHKNSRSPLALPPLSPASTPALQLGIFCGIHFGGDGPVARLLVLCLQLLGATIPLGPWVVK